MCQSVHRAVCSLPGGNILAQISVCGFNDAQAMRGDEQFSLYTKAIRVSNPQHINPAPKSTLHPVLFKAADSQPPRAV